MFCNHRTEVVETIKQLYWLQVCEKDPSKPKLNLFGVSSKELGMYVTSEKDLIRRINRIPDSDFLLNNAGEKKKDRP